MYFGSHEKDKLLNEPGRYFSKIPFECYFYLGRIKQINKMLQSCGYENEVFLPVSLLCRRVRPCHLLPSLPYMKGTNLTPSLAVSREGFLIPPLKNEVYINIVIFVSDFSHTIKARPTEVELLNLTDRDRGPLTSEAWSGSWTSSLFVILNKRKLSCHTACWVLSAAVLQDSDCVSTSVAANRVV